MPCYHPVQAFESSFKKANGKSVIKFRLPLDSSISKYAPIKLPCGRCIGCRLERSRQWALRCMHESSLHSRNCFITLTYNQESLPPGGSLPEYQGGHFQLFIKRLRKKYGSKIKFFHCGEYGEKNFRPHYHACLFNFDFNDRELYKTSNGNNLYTSKSLSDLWSDPNTGRSYGFCTIGDVTFESAAYVARYITKKITGDKAAEHYQGKKPEYITMSRRPGIGAGWYEKYKDDCYPSDFLVHDEKKMKPPKFYEKLLEKEDPLMLKNLKDIRKQHMKEDDPEQSEERLRVKEVVKMSHFKELKRSYENEN